MQSGGVPKYVITNLKINNFKEKNQQEILIAIFLPLINLDEHVSTKINRFRIYKGGLGQKNFFLNKMEAFPYFFAFGKAP